MWPWLHSSCKIDSVVLRVVVTQLSLTEKVSCYCLFSPTLLNAALQCRAPPSFRWVVCLLVRIGQCFNCLCRTISQILSFCDVPRHVHSFKHSFCALSLTSVVNVFAALAPLVVQPYRMCPAFDLLQTALACTGRHSRARGLLKFAVQLCEETRTGRLKTGWQSCSDKSGSIARACAL